MMEQAHAAMDLPLEGALGPAAGDSRMGEEHRTDGAGALEGVVASEGVVALDAVSCGDTLRLIWDIPPTDSGTGSNILYSCEYIFTKRGKKHAWL